MESPPLNLKAAQCLVKSRDFSELRPWGHATMWEVVDAFSKRVSRDVGDYVFTTDLYHESSLARELDMRLRLYSGYVPTAAPPPRSIKAELNRGVPSYLLGHSVLQCPKVVRYLFFVELPLPVWEFDLVASHMRQFRMTAVQANMQTGELVSSFASCQSIEAFRHSVAHSAGVSPKSIKKLTNAVGYGSSGEEWCRAERRDQLPGRIVTMKADISAVRTRFWADASEKVRTACATRQHPELTCMSLKGQEGERTNMEAITEAVTARQGITRGFIFDAVVSTECKDPKEMVAMLAQRGVLVKLDDLTRSASAYKTMVESKFGTLDWSELPSVIVEARAQAATFLAWLYDKSHDEARGGRPYVTAARAVSPYLPYFFNRNTKQTEYFDESIGVWRPSGGEFLISGDMLSRTLVAHLRHYRMEYSYAGGKKKAVTVQSRPHTLLLDPAMTSALKGCLETIVTPHGHIALGEAPNAKFELVFANRITLDFTQPYDAQVRVSAIQDRNCRYTSMNFEAIPHTLNFMAGDMPVADFLNSCNCGQHSSEYVMERVGPPLLDMMRAGMVPMFQHIYYETAGGRLDSENPEEGLTEAFYALRQDVGAISGMRAGFEEYVLEWGPLGDNGKGTRRSVREAVLSNADRQRSIGYSAVVESALVRNAFDMNAPNEDLVKCKHAREVVIDDFTTSHGTKKLNNATLRSLTGGNVISGHGKNEKPMNIAPDYLIRMIFNDFPQFEEKLIDADRRRIAILFYPCTFKPAGSSLYDPANPNHRLQSAFKAQSAEFAQELVEWCRVLASATHAGQLKYIWPRPTSMEDLIESRMPDMKDSDAGLCEKFIAQRLTNLQPDTVPPSRDAVIKAFSVWLGGDGESVKSEPYRAAQVALKNRLYSPEKAWCRRISGVRHQQRVFKFANDALDTSVCTFTAPAEAEGAAAGCA